MNCVNEQELGMFPLLGENLQHPYHYSHSTFKPSAWNSSSEAVLDPAQQAPGSFAGPHYAGQVGLVKPKEEASHEYGVRGSQKRTMSNKLSHAKDHIMAERKRREKLSQRFIALSAIVPGLKKVLNLYYNSFLPSKFISIFIQITLSALTPLAFFFINRLSQCFFL